MLAPVSFRIPKSLRDRFDRVCEAGAVNKSKLIRRWIEEYTAGKEKELGVMAKVIEVLEMKEDYPVIDEAYTVGKADDGRYFFTWGPDLPYQDEVPAWNIPDGESGISWRESEEGARVAMQVAIEAVESTRE